MITILFYIFCVLYLAFGVMAAKGAIEALRYKGFRQVLVGLFVCVFWLVIWIHALTKMDRE